MTKTIRIPSARVATADTRALTLAERLLRMLGVDAALMDCVFGDLAEERAERSAQQGRIIAGLWYSVEAIRSAPHLIVNALRYGGPMARARIAAACGAVMIVTSGVAVAFALRDGPPARIIAGGANASDGIVVNNVKPVQLPVHAVDKRGHRLESEPVRYAWVSGAPISVSPTGAVACRMAGDAIVRASSGAASADVSVRCRPVNEIRTSSWVDLVAGDPPRDLPFTAIGIDGLPVLQLRGAVRLLDSSVAVYDGSTIRPRGVGQTVIFVDVGDRSAAMRVIVHEQVTSFAPLRADQRNVAIPVRVAVGDTVHWALPAGVFWLKYLPRRSGETPPTITVEGPITCTTGDGIRVYRMPIEEYGKYCLARSTGASVLVAHGANGLPVAEGSLLLQRVP